MKCRRCTDTTYCPCADFFASWRAYHRGEIDHLMTPQQIAQRVAGREERPAQSRGADHAHQ
jgi:hypothetical protein